MRTRLAPHSLPGRLPPSDRDCLQLPDSSASSGRSLVSSFHVTLSGAGRGVGLRSLSARTTTLASPVGKRLGRERLDGGGVRGVASPGPRPPLLPSTGRPPRLRPELELTAGGRAQLLSERRRGWWVPHPCCPSPPAPSDMVAPGSVTSRLGSVFPFLLVLVDLQYEGESGTALAGGAGPWARPPCAALLRPGASLGAARTVRDSAVRPGPEPAPGWRPAPGSGFAGERGAGARGPLDRDSGCGVRRGPR